MASFDPSVLSDIGSSGPDIAGSMAKGFQLKDMVDGQQMNQLKLNSLKSDQADQTKAKGILSSADLTTEKGLTEAQEKLTRAGLPQQGLDLRKHGQSVISGELDNKLKQVDLHSAAVDVVSGGIDKIWQQATAMKNEKTPDGRLKYTDASVNAWIQGQIPLEVSSIQSDAGLPEDVKKTALQNINSHLAKGQQMTYDSLTQIERGTKQGQAQLKSIRDDLTAQTGAKREQAYERSVDNQGRLGQERVNQGQEKIDNAKQKFISQGFSDHQGEMLAALADANVSLPAGLRSQAQIKATIDGLYAEHPDLSAKEITEGIKSGKLKLAAETKAAQTAGTQIGKVSVAVNEIEPFGRQVLEASKDIPRGSSLTMNGLIQLGEKEVQDPKLLVLRAKLQALNNAYDQLAARGGTDKDKREHIHSLFDARLNEANVQALVKAVNEEGAGAKEAADRTIGEVSGTSIPGTGQTPSQGRPKQVSSDADYNALPSGTDFIGPDGKHRKKP